MSPLSKLVNRPQTPAHCMPVGGTMVFHDVSHFPTRSLWWLTPLLLSTTTPPLFSTTTTTTMERGALGTLLFSPPVRYDPFTGFLYVYTRILSGGPASPVIFINASRPFEMVSRLIRAALMRYSVCLLLVKAARIKYKTELTERRHRARRSGV